MKPELRRALSRLAACQTQLDKAIAETEVASVGTIAAGELAGYVLAVKEMMRISGRLQSVAEILNAQNNYHGAKKARRQELETEEAFLQEINTRDAIERRP